MSKKSRQPESSGKADKKGKKAKRGKGGKGAEAGQRRLVVESQPPGVPFPVVVLLAAVMTLPSVTNYMGGGLRFDALMVRAIAALAVSWLLATLVHAVFESMRPPEVTAVLDLEPEQAYDAVAARGALSGTIVDDPLAPEPDPFVVDPVAPLPGPAVPDLGAGDPQRGEPAA